MTYMLIINKKIITAEEARDNDVDINVDDIAFALSNQPCYLGRSEKFYSYADHCIRFAHNAPPDDKMYGLMYCAWRAYGTKSIQGHIEGEVGVKSHRVLVVTKKILVQLRATERRDLFGMKEEHAAIWTIKPLSASVARVEFLKLFEALNYAGKYRASANVTGNCKLGKLSHPDTHAKGTQSWLSQGFIK